MANPKGYAGRGTVIGFSTTPSNYLPLPQLEKFERSGSKTDFDDITCLDSPGSNKFPAPVVIDNGKYTGEGVYDPQNPNITALQAYQQAMTQLYYQLTLIDGSLFTGLCYVEMFEAPKVDRYKINRYQFAIMIFGAETAAPQGGTPFTE